VEKRRGIRFLVLFFLILVGGFILVALNPVNDRVIVPYTGWIATVSAHILRVIGQDVVQSGTVLFEGGFGVNIQNGCNGVEAMLIVISAMAAFPATALSRVTGILVGIVIIQGLNFFRVVSLFLLGKYHPAVFDLFHVAVWQSVIVLAGVGIFLLWSSRFAVRLEDRG
jgi:exosortase H (IPTLxxWG-CTERM-specific)